MPSLRNEQPKPEKQNYNPNPDGLYSGMTKRLAISDGTFVDVGGKIGDSRTMANLPHPDERDDL